MNTFLTIVIVIASIILILAVLAQNGKGEGLASNFVSANNVLGARGAAEGLEKATWILVAIVLVLSIVVSFTAGTNGVNVDITEKIENVTTQEQPSFPTAPIQQEAPTTESAE